MKVASTPATVILSPTRKLCAAAVVRVATLSVRALLFTVAVEIVTGAEYSPTRPRSCVSALFPSPTNTNGLVTARFSAPVSYTHLTLPTKRIV